MNYKLLIALLMIILGGSCHRNDPLDYDNRPKTIILTRGQKSTNRPRVPEHQKIEVVYTGIELIFHFEIPEGKCNVELIEESTEFIQRFEFDSTPLTASIPVHLYLSTQITLQTQSDKTYRGTICFE